MSIFNIFRPIRMRIRSFFKKRMMPMTVDEAEEKREFFAKIYFLTAFFSFSYIIYKMYQKQTGADSSKNLPENIIKKLNLDENIRVVRYEGFNKVADYYYKENSDENEKSKHQNLNPEFSMEVLEPKDSELLKS